MAVGQVNVSSGNAGLNLFTQMNEPVIKEGIWIQTDKNYRNVVNETNMHIGEQVLNPISHGYFNPPNLLPHVSVCSWGSTIYLFTTKMNGSPTTNNCYLYKYDTVNKLWTQLWTIIDQSWEGATIGYYNNKIYVFGGAYNNESSYSQVRTIDLSTLTHSVVTNMPVTGFKRAVAFVNGHFYVAGGYSTYTTPIQSVHKYNPMTNIWTTLGNVASSSGATTNPNAAIIGTDIYFLINTSTHMKLDTTSDTISFSSSISLSPNIGGGFISSGNKLYSVGGRSSQNTSNILTNVTVYDFTTSGRTFIPINNRYAHSVVANYACLASVTVNGFIYTFGGLFYPDTGSTSHARPLVISIGTKQFDDKTFIIHKANENTGTYYTELVSPMKRYGGSSPNRITSGFNDAWLFDDGDLQSNLPTYYGNGTQWIKFKN